MIHYIIDLIVYLTYALRRHLFLPRGFRVQCCACKKHLHGPKTGAPSHGYCFRCYHKMMDETRRKWGL